jgi:outer membrane lipoprotein SlyB
MQRLRLFSALLIVLILAACSPKDSSQASTDSSNAPHANVVLRDGTKLSGTVKSSTPTELTLNLDDGSTRTVLTKDIKSMDYGDAKGSAPAQEAKNEAPALPRPEKAAIQTKTFVIPAGSEVSVRNDETIDSANASDGQTYAAEVTSDVKDSDGAIVIPRGANAQLVIKSASSGGKIRGASDLVVDLRSVSVGGQQYALNTTDLEEKGKQGIGANKRTGEFLGGGAALGGIIGAIAGGGKGAAIGAASGAGAGALTQILTKGGSIKIPAETVMTFKLDQAVKIIERK